MQRIFSSDADKNIPIRLTPKELEKPVIVLINFFRAYNLIEVRKLLEDWMIKACSEQDNSIHGYKEKSSIMFLRYQLEALIEATHVILEGTASKKKAKRPSIKTKA